jgi:hypothetical protein
MFFGAVLGVTYFSFHNFGFISVHFGMVIASVQGLGVGAAGVGAGAAACCGASVPETSARFFGRRRAPGQTYHNERMNSHP